MSLQTLNDQELIASFQQAVKNERKIMHLVVLHIQEINRRGLHLVKYGSLFDYLVKDLKYSSASAQRRIMAARLLNEVPSVAAKLETGELNLSQIGELQRAVNTAEKIHQAIIPTEVKAELVEMILGQKSAETQKICAEVLNIPPVEPQRIKTQRDESKRVEVTLTKSQFEKYEKVRDLLAHKHLQGKGTQQFNDVLETMFDEILFQNRPTKTALTKQKIEATATSTVPSPQQELSMTTRNSDTKACCSGNAMKKDDLNIITATKQNPKDPWHSLTPKRKRVILAQDQCCQHITDLETGEICGNTFNLHIDHITPKHAGGTNAPGNLRVLCRAHNLYREHVQGLKQDLSRDREPSARGVLH
jgi:hypothetical protein